MRSDSQSKTKSYFLLGVGLIVFGMMSEFLLGTFLPSEIMQSLYMNSGFLAIIIFCFAWGVILIRRGLLGEWRYRYDTIIYTIAAVFCFASAGQTFLGLQMGHPWLYLQEINPILMNILWMFVLPVLNPWTTMILGFCLIIFAGLNIRFPPSIQRINAKPRNQNSSDPETVWKFLGDLTRISVWLGSLLLFILAFVILGSPPLSPGPWSPLYFLPMWWALGLGIIAISCFNSVVFIINQLGDLDTDQLHTEKADLPISAGRISKGRAIIIAMTFLILGLIVGFWVSITFMFIVIFTLIFATLYSFPPTRLKGRPFLDIIIVGFGFGFWAVFAAWGLYTSLPPSLEPLPYVPFILLLGSWLFYSGTHGIHTASDFQADKKAGVKTTAVFLGPQRATILGIVLIAAGLLLMYSAVGYYTHLFWYGLLKYKSIFLLTFLGLPFFALFQQFRRWQKLNEYDESELHGLQKQGRQVTYVLFFILLIYLLFYVFFFYPVYYPHYFFPWI